MKTVSELNELEYGNMPVEGMDIDGQHYIGLTKREHFAGLAMQANRANPQYSEAKSEEIAKYAVEDADALLKELEK